MKANRVVEAVRYGVVRGSVYDKMRMVSWSLRAKFSLVAS